MSKALGMTWVLWITGFILLLQLTNTSPYSSLRLLQASFFDLTPPASQPHLSTPSTWTPSCLCPCRSYHLYLGRFWFPPWTSNNHSHSALFPRYKPNGLFLVVFPNPGLVADLVFCPIFFVSIWQVDSSGQDSHEGEWMGLSILKSSTFVWVCSPHLSSWNDNNQFCFVL